MPEAVDQGVAGVVVPPTVKKKKYLAILKTAPDLPAPYAQMEAIDNEPLSYLQSVCAESDADLLMAWKTQS